MDLYVVSDVHGDYEALERALYNADLIDTAGRRNMNQKSRDAHIIQLGDLANCVEDSVDDDMNCLSKVESWIDLMLVGNHEIPYFDRANTFSGFHYDEMIDQRMTSLFHNGLIGPCYVHGDMLITHAGITRPQLNFGTGTTAVEVSAKLHAEWEIQNFHHYLFGDVGTARYGPNGYGGVLWCDFDKEFSPCDFPQVVGHTPGILRQKGNTLCIDTIQSTGLPTVLKLEA